MMLDDIREGDLLRVVPDSPNWDADVWGELVVVFGIDCVWCMLGLLWHDGVPYYGYEFSDEFDTGLELVLRCVV